MDAFSERKYVISAMILLLCLIYIVRLFYIQVVDESYMLSAENNSRRYIVKYPARGLIFDRKHRLIAYNEAAYDLQVISAQLKPFDTVMLERILEVDHSFLLNKLKEAKQKRYRPYIIIKQLTSDSYAQLQEVLHRFQGFSVQVRTIRHFPYNCGAHILGYTQEVDSNNIKKDRYYEMGDYIGVSGIEKSYEKELRGIKGGEYFNVDVLGRVKGRLEGGKYDRHSEIGTNIYSTIDIELQAYGEKLLRNKIGSIVAIEPATGEILALVSSPGFNPNVLTGRHLNKYFQLLKKDTLLPLYNRAINGDMYPPGSTFKVVNALIGQQEGVCSRHTYHSCNGGYFVGSFKVGCHVHRSPVNLVESVQMSCNAYYCNVFRNILDNRKYGKVSVAYDVWRKHVMSFGLGDLTGIDLPGEKPGMIPKASYFDKYYGKDRWKSLTVISLSIGQGEIGVTPLQMANLVTTIANRGFYKIPHVIKGIDDASINPKYLVKHYSTVESKYFEPVIEGMFNVVQGGEGATAGWTKVPDIEICGKTGTAQNPHGEDHSIFMAFAPKVNPKIAISVYVENAGYGSSWAAPIATLLIEKYINDTIKRDWFEKRILEANLINAKP
ncbi:MAG: penicillin-binding protein 2 [Bacteroidales bacterium]|nr:penicillin-binding protein 2 [Bacteroidales bacterium]